LHPSNAQFGRHAGQHASPWISRRSEIFTGASPRIDYAGFGKTLGAKQARIAGAARTACSSGSQQLWVRPKSSPEIASRHNLGFAHGDERRNLQAGPALDSAFVARFAMRRRPG
jgi:hypothetical protein